MEAIEGIEGVEDINVSVDVEGLDGLPENCPYQLQGLLGKGSFGAVYRVIGEGGVNYALKITSDILDISMIELDILTRFRHPYLLHRQHTLIVDECQEHTGGGVGILLPLGVTDAFHAMKMNVPTSTWITYLYQCLVGLNYLHQQGILHLDIKPANIIIFDSIRDGRAVLADFTLSYRTIDGKFIASGMERITQGYRPRSEDETDIYSTASDIWALGATFLHILSGEIPGVFERNIARLLQLVPEPFQNILRDMLHPQPEARPSAEELLAYPLFEAGAVNDSTVSEDLLLGNIVTEERLQLPTVNLSPDVRADVLDIYRNIAASIIRITSTLPVHIALHAVDLFYRILTYIPLDITGDLNLTQVRKSANEVAQNVLYIMRDYYALHRLSIPSTWYFNSRLLAMLKMIGGYLYRPYLYEAATSKSHLMVLGKLLRDPELYLSVDLPTYAAEVARTVEGQGDKNNISREERELWFKE